MDLQQTGASSQTARNSPVDPEDLPMAVTELPRLLVHGFRHLEIINRAYLYLMMKAVKWSTTDGCFTRNSENAKCLPCEKANLLLQTWND